MVDRSLITKDNKLFSEDLEGIQNQDRVCNAINACTFQKIPISFSWLKENWGCDHGIWSNLGRGKGVLKSFNELNQYLYSYGGMISGQWEKLFSHVEFKIDQEKYELVDYGCGQGLAGLLLKENVREELFPRVEKVVLIDPSIYALVRAAAVYHNIAPHAKIVLVCKKFDDVTVDDLHHNVALTRIHIFSNVLDLPNYRPFELFAKLLQEGHHNIFAVSHDRHHNGGSQPFYEIKNALDNQDKIMVHFSQIYQYKCGKDDKFDVIAWAADIEVHQ